MTTLLIGGHTIILGPGDHIRTVLAGGAQVLSVPGNSPSDIARAHALGYGGDTAAMSRDHEITHALLAAMLGLPESPTIRGVAEKQWWPHWWDEEAAVLAIQRFARTAGVDLLSAALKASAPAQSASSGAA